MHKPLILIIAVIAMTCPAYAGWSEPRRISEPGGTAYPQIVAQGDTLHVVYYAIRTNEYIGYLRSTDAGQNWSKLGGASDPLDQLDVYDIETLRIPSDPVRLTVGTSAGIYEHTNEFDQPWVYKAFGEAEVHVVESIDQWDSEQQVAAVAYTGGDRKLYFTRNGWVSWQEILLPGGLSFDKEIRDLSAVYWAGGEGPVSIYAATSEGFYLLDIDAEDNPIYATAYDLREASSFGYTPLRYDYNAQAVDYHLKFGTPYDTSFVLASTDFNVYQIIEVRDSGNNNIVSVDISEAVTGTYIANVVALSYPTSAGANQIYALSDKSIIKKYDGGRWMFIGSSLLKDFNNINLSNDTETCITGTNYIIRVSGPNVIPSHIWASGDSGSSWIELPLGEIPAETIINCVASAEDSSGAVVVGTKYGVFYIESIEYYMEKQVAEDNER